MQELKWLDGLPERSLDAGVKLLDELGWHIRVREQDGFWFVNSGHTCLLKTTVRESVDALLYGLAIAHATFPKLALEEVRKFLKECEGQ